MNETAEVSLDTTVDAQEIARFSAVAAQWWDPRGAMRMLHKFNPVRLAFIKEAACRQFDRDYKRRDALAGLRILDIGCGAGILSEPLARMGASVVGADPSAANIAAARLHAAQGGLTIDYRLTTVRGARRCRRAFRGRARHGGGRACGGPESVRSRDARTW